VDARRGLLYVNDTQRRHIRVFDLQPNGTLARQTDRVFVDLGGETGQTRNL
jgi:sugar lactone lactonase YvrE